MTDQPNGRDVEALAAALHEITCEDNPGHAEWEGCATTGPCADEGARLAVAFGYAERIAQARREGCTAPRHRRTHKQPPRSASSGPRHPVGADRRCPVHGHGDMTRWRHLRAALRDDA